MAKKPLPFIDDIELELQPYYEEKYHGELPDLDMSARLEDFDKYKNYVSIIDEFGDVYEKYDWEWKPDVPEEDYYDPKHYWIRWRE